VKRLAGLILALAAPVAAQSPARLTLTQAEDLGLKNNPRVSVALLNALAANQVTAETRSNFYPYVTGGVTGVGALDQSRIAIGSLSTSQILNHVGVGFTVNQLITDFGRTSNLTASADLRARAQQQTANATRAEVLVQVRQAYFAALRAQSLLRIAEQTVAARQIVADQVEALAKSKLKSGLDLSFATVNLSEAKLLLLNAQNNQQAALADLVQAMGAADAGPYELVEENLPPELQPEATPLIDEAIARRPDLQRLRLERDSARRFARAERDLWFPVITGIGTAGLVPLRDPVISSRWAAAGVNATIPIFNGFLFNARRAEAELAARAADQRTRDGELRAIRDVRVAFLNAQTTRQRIDVAAQLLSQANLALELSQARYQLGLSSIVELSQAQLSQTAAEIASAGAKYDYQIQRAVLDYQIGMFR
jgi:outer membrane protein